METNWYGERALSGSAIYRQLLDAIPDPVVVYDPGGRAAYLNPAFEQVYGWSRKELLGKRIDFVPSEEMEPTRNAWDRTLAGEKVYFETRRRTKQGKLLDILIRTAILTDDADRHVASIVIHRDITPKRIEAALRLREANLRRENLRLRSTLSRTAQFGSIVGKSKPMQDVYRVILKAAASNANVLIYGESGTGKELVAHTIHELSDRHGRRFVTVNCGAIPHSLLESEFFGYKRGAFTGAETDKPGFLDVADGGTLFLDEIGELDTAMQVKLLRAVDGGGYTPIGSNTTKVPDVRIVAATNRDLKQDVASGRIRRDFYYRIHIIPIYLPPLRVRTEDMPLLVQHFLQKFSDTGSIQFIPEQMFTAMKRYHWPGNIRELQNTLHRFVTLKEVDPIFAEADAGTADAHEDIASELSVGSGAPATLEAMMDRFEKVYLQRVLRENRWNRSKAAGILGVNRRTLYRKIRKHSLQ